MSALPLAEVIRPLLPEDPPVGAALVADNQGAVQGAAAGCGLELNPGIWHQPMRIASITKSFTAATILRLAEEGALDPGDPVGRHLPERLNALLGAHGYGTGLITVAMLLSHTAGLPDHTNAPLFGERLAAVPGYIWTAEEQIALGMTLASVGAPGQHFSYSDTGYVLLGQIIEQITGQPLCAALRQLIGYDRLGLNACWMEKAEQAPNHLSGFFPQHHGGKAAAMIDASADLFGGGGLISTLPELIRFFRALLTGQIFRSPASLAAMCRVSAQSVAAGGRRYGYGLEEIRSGGRAWYGHFGFWGTAAFYCPETDRGVAVAVTSTAGGPVLKPFLDAAMGLAD